MSDNQQPIALRLAEELETMFMETPIECEKAAILLREQHSEIERLNLQHNAIVNAATAERDALHTELKLVRELMRNAEARAEQAEARFAQASERAIGHVARRKELLAEIDQLRAAPEAPKRKPLTDAMVEAAGRALSDRHSNGCGCGMDKDVVWSSYSDEFKEQARVALEAAMLAAAPDPN